MQFRPDYRNIVAVAQNKKPASMPPESYLIMLDEYKLLCTKGVKIEIV